MDLCGVSFIDAAGKVLLKEIHQQGGKLIAEGCLNQAIVEEIEGRDRTGKGGLLGPEKGFAHYFLCSVFQSGSDSDGCARTRNCGDRIRCRVARRAAC